MEVGNAPRARRWLAWLAMAAWATAVALVLAVAGTRTIGLVLAMFAAVVALLIAAWLAVAHRGLIRIVGVALGLAAAAGLVVALVRNDLLWLVLVTGALAAVVLAAGHAALARPRDQPAHEAEPAAPRASHPFLIMNPRSGDGKAQRFGLREKAEALGVEVAVLEGPEHVDVAELARKAIDNGADLVGVAGGDGTQALVAAVAAEEGVPLFVVPAGTRNHFALDLGIDRNDLGASLEALHDGVDLTVDLGDVGGRPFVNNVSFGAYAAIVERPDYRADKLHVTMQALPDLLTGSDGSHLRARADEGEIDEPQALLVSNNSYGTGDLAGAGRRLRLDGGQLGVLAVRVASARDAALLARGMHSANVTRMTADQVFVDSDDDMIPAGVDGESVLLPRPVRCRVRPGALRVRVPRHRPGLAEERPPVRLGDLVRVAVHGVAAD